LEDRGLQGEAAASICAYNPDSSLKWMVALPTTNCDAAEEAFAKATTPCTYQVLPTTTLVMGPGGTLLVPTEQLATARGENAQGPTTDVYYGPYLFYALNSADGSIGWSIDTYDPLLNPPAMGADGTIYMECAGPGPSGDVCAYSSAGTELWNYDTEYALGSLGPTDVQGSFGINSAPAIGVDGTVYAGDVYGHLWAIGPGPTGTLQKVAKLTYVLHSPLNILITLPNGEQAGFDSAGTLVNTAGATVIPPGPGPTRDGHLCRSRGGAIRIADFRHRNWAFHRHGAVLWQRRQRARDYELHGDGHRRQRADHLPWSCGRRGDEHAPQLGPVEFRIDAGLRSGVDAGQRYDHLHGGALGR